MQLTNPKETLTILTADHETGGLAINGYLERKDAIGDRLLGSATEHDGKYPRSIVSWATGPNHKDNPEKTNYNHPAAIYAPDASHTAVDVPMLALGVGSHRFAGFLDNTDIPHHIAEVMGSHFTGTSNKENKTTFFYSAM